MAQRSRHKCQVGAPAKALPVQLRPAKGLAALSRYAAKRSGELSSPGVQARGHNTL